MVGGWDERSALRAVYQASDYRAGRCRNWDLGTRGKHWTKKQKFLVCQLGLVGAEFRTLGPVASIRLKIKNS